MATIKIREVTDSGEGDQMVFITNSGQRFNLQDADQRKKLKELLDSEQTCSEDKE